MSGRHAGLARTSRRSLVLLGGATVLGLWFGLRAPDVSPVAAPPPAVQVQPADQVLVPPAVVPVAPQPAAGRLRDGGR